MEYKSKQRILAGTAWTSMLVGGYMLFSAVSSPSFRNPVNSRKLLEEQSLVQSQSYWEGARDKIYNLERDYTLSSEKNPDFYTNIKNLERLCAIENESVNKKLRDLRLSNTFADEKKIAQGKSAQVLNKSYIGGGLCVLALVLACVGLEIKDKNKK